jgi:predicted transcriptional regulator YdeE
MNEIMMNSDRSEAEKVEKLAVEHQRQTYDHIAHLVDLYTFYVNQEIDDKEPTKENLTDDMHFYLIEGTYNMLDYKKMMDDGQKVWNEIWDLVKKYGQQMGD